MKKTISLLLIISMMICTMILFPNSASKVYAATQNYYVQSVTYDYGNKGDYELSTEIEKASFSVASIEVSGDINTSTKYYGYQAYGVKTGNVTFNLVYNREYQDESGDIYLIEDGNKKVDGRKLDEKIKKGVLILQKSNDGESWEDLGSPVVNVFGDNPNGIKNIYTTNGDDVKKGCYYRVLLAYKTRNKLESSKILWWEKENHEDHKYLEVSEFYICLNTAEITLHNLSTKDSDIQELVDGYSLEVLKKGENLLDGSATKDGFSIDTNGAAYKVSVNGKSASNGDKFTKDGKYTVIATSNLGASTTKSIYVFSGGADKGFSAYFEENIVSGKRVFREGEYPTYAIGAKAYIKKMEDDVPGISGQITNTSTGEVITLKEGIRGEQSVELSEGSYCAELYSGNVNAGSVFHYTFLFNIIGEDAKPYVNYTTLMNLDRLADLASKNYQVVYQTTGGGYIYVCFNSYDDAYAYAYDIEKRFVEWSDGQLYYKSEENPNVKVKYDVETPDDKIKLTKMINYYARQNVEISYINPNEEFTYQPIAESERNLLKCLELLSIRQSIKVFSTNEEKEKAFMRAPYLNGYKFIHVDDYDVVSVEALCKKDGEKYSLNFIKPVEDQLTVSSIYTIIETNAYGDELTYDAVYMGENQTVSKWEKVYKGETSEVIVNASSNESVTADLFILKEISNELDEGAIIKIVAPEVYSYSLTGQIGELRNLALYKKGTYTISFVDRVGNTYELLVSITGDSSYKEATSGNNKSYTDVYNDIYLNDKDGSEEN